MRRCLPSEPVTECLLLRQRGRDTRVYQRRLRARVTRRGPGGYVRSTSVNQPDPSTVALRVVERNPDKDQFRTSRVAIPLTCGLQRSSAVPRATYDRWRPRAGNAQVTIQAAPGASGASSWGYSKYRRRHSARRCVGRSHDQGIGNPARCTLCAHSLGSQLIAGLFVFRQVGLRSKKIRSRSWQGCPSGRMSVECHPWQSARPCSTASHTSWSSTRLPETVKQASDRIGGLIRSTRLEQLASPARFHALHPVAAHSRLPAEAHR